MLPLTSYNFQPQFIQFSLVNLNTNISHFACYSFSHHHVARQAERLSIWAFEHFKDNRMFCVSFLFSFTYLVSIAEPKQSVIEYFTYARWAQWFWFGVREWRFFSSFLFFFVFISLILSNRQAENMAFHGGQRWKAESTFLILLDEFSSFHWVQMP